MQATKGVHSGWHAGWCVLLLRAAAVPRLLLASRVVILVSVYPIKHLPGVVSKSLICSLADL
jgi:hypothetical protein